LAFLLVKINVSFEPGVPDRDRVKVMRPSHTELFKCTLIMKHHSIARDIGVFDSILFDPGSQQGFGFVVVAQDHNVQWFHCTIVRYGH